MCGTWEGTLSGCSIEIPLAGEFDIPDLPISMMFANGTNVSQLDVTFGMNSGTASVDGDKVTLDPTSMEFDGGGFPVTITISGVGTLATDTRIDMDLNLEVLGRDYTNYQQHIYVYLLYVKNFNTFFQMSLSQIQIVLSSALQNYVK